MTFAPSLGLTLAFAALTLAVAAQDLWLLRQAAPADRRRRWTWIAATLIPLWLAAHALIAESGVLALETFPPPPVPYLGLILICAGVIAFSQVGGALSRLPLWWLVAAQAFRLPWRSSSTPCTAKASSPSR